MDSPANVPMEAWTIGRMQRWTFSPNVSEGGDLSACRFFEATAPPDAQNFMLRQGQYDIFRGAHRALIDQGQSMGELIDETNSQFLRFQKIFRDSQAQFVFDRSTIAQPIPHPVATDCQRVGDDLTFAFTLPHNN